MRTVETFDAIILGAGGAGLFAAATAAQRGVRCLVLDHANAPGKKILISGGGRCNFTNLHTAPDRYLSDNPRFATSALRRYTAADFIARVDQHGIAWHEKTLGQLFCDGSAKQIVAMLMEDCTAGGAVVRVGTSIRDVARRDGAFTVSIDYCDVSAPALVIATGGPSIPKMGATGFAFDLARQFGLALVTPRPALVPLTFAPDAHPFAGLQGVAAPVVATCGRTRFTEAALVTHRGLSGPSILQISSYWQPGAAITLDLLAGRRCSDWLITEKRARPRVQMRTLLADILPERLAIRVADILGLMGPLGDLTDRTLRAAEVRLRAWQLMPN
ncbi:MAG: aminoacetone oxidase family FAD-binding enzyme, partial [Pseudomonadota bacterium]